MRLPGENELRDSIREQLASELQVTSELLGIGTRIFLDGKLPNPKDEMDHLEAWMCLGIVAKACRQYRGIVALAEIGLGDVADSNGRMLAETMLAAEFLMRPSFVLKCGESPLSEVPGYPLTTAFRTRLYLAHDAASTLKTLREMAKHGEIEPEEAARVLKVAEEHAKQAAEEIGPEWAKRQKDRGSYSGVSALNLAESIGMPMLYHTFYRPSSAGVHATNARQYIEPEERPDGRITFHACSSAKGVAEALIFASLMMHQVLSVANQRFGFDLDERLNKIAPWIQNMTRRLPDE